MGLIDTLKRWMVPKPRRLPTPQETAQAEAQLRVADAAQARLAENMKKMSGDQKWELLKAATKALEKSKNLDPAARIEGWNHDSLAARLLYTDAFIDHQWAIDQENHETTSEGSGHYQHYKMNMKLAKDGYKRAEQAALRAILFEPNNTTYLNQLAKSQAKLNKRNAHETINRILAIDPGNIEALTLQNQL